MEFDHDCNWATLKVTMTNVSRDIMTGIGNYGECRPSYNKTTIKTYCLKNDSATNFVDDYGT